MTWPHVQKFIISVNDGSWYNDCRFSECSDRRKCWWVMCYGSYECLFLEHFLYACCLIKLLRDKNVIWALQAIHLECRIFFKKSTRIFIKKSSLLVRTAQNTLLIVYGNKILKKSSPKQLLTKNTAHRNISIDNVIPSQWLFTEYVKNLKVWAKNLCFATSRVTQEQIDWSFYQLMGAM